MMTILVW